MKTIKTVKELTEAKKKIGELVKKQKELDEQYAVINGKQTAIENEIHHVGPRIILEELKSSGKLKRWITNMVLFKESNNDRYQIVFGDDGEKRLIVKTFTFQTFGNEPTTLHVRESKILAMDFTDDMDRGWVKEQTDKQKQVMLLRMNHIMSFLTHTLK